MPIHAPPHQPPVDFERRYNVTGIATHYHYPNESGWSWQELHQVFENYIDIMSKPELLKTYTQEFEAKTGHKGVTPEKLDTDKALYEAMTQFIHDRKHTELTAIFTRLEALNPDTIGTLKFNRDSHGAMHDALLGVLSAFNPDDINLYLKRSEEAPTLEQTVRQKFTPAETARKRIDQKIMKHLGHADRDSMGWIASPATQLRVWEQIKTRAPEPTDRFTSDGIPIVG